MDSNFTEELTKKLEKLGYPLQLDAKQLKEVNEDEITEEKKLDEEEKSKVPINRTQIEVISETRGKNSASTSHRNEEKCGSNIPVTDDQIKDETTSKSSEEEQTENVLPSIVLHRDGELPFDSEEGPPIIKEKVHRIVEAFQNRTDRMRRSIVDPSSPDSLTDEEDEGVPTVDMKKRLDSLVPDLNSRPNSRLEGLVGVNGSKAKLKRLWIRTKKYLTPSAAIEPTSRLYIVWLVIGASCYIYNTVVVPLRVVFSHFQTESNIRSWMFCDYFCDLVYLLDILLFNFRVKFIDNGFWVGEPKLIRHHYARGKKFKVDLLSLLPLDLLYFLVGPMAILRLPRLLKIHIFWDCFNRLDSVLSSAHLVRLTRTTFYLLFIIHLNSCAYYAMSKVQGIGANGWVYDGEGSSYIRCFYFATKTVTSIGKNPRPSNDYEHFFMIVAWLLGVFIFAVLIGQVKDIMATASQARTEYRSIVDASQTYMQNLNIPTELQDRVKMWFSYTWQSQKTLNETESLEFLPKKMRTDVALSVHIHTLAKVQLFQDCDKGLLRDLVLKLKSVIYLPGDYVCRKGEVGKEMYIIQSGQVQVVGGPNNEKVFATLSEGSVFGEVSLLAVGTGNRRTADVRSRGFSNLFVLSKMDLNDAIRDYPQAQEILRKKARKLLKQTGNSQTKEVSQSDIIFEERPATPKLIHTVYKVVPQDSYTATFIRRTSMRIGQSHFLPQLTESLTTGEEQKETSETLSKIRTPCIGCSEMLLQDKNDVILPHQGIKKKHVAACSLGCVCEQDNLSLRVPIYKFTAKEWDAQSAESFGYIATDFDTRENIDLLDSFSDESAVKINKKKVLRKKRKKCLPYLCDKCKNTLNLCDLNTASRPTTVRFASDSDSEASEELYDDWGLADIWKKLDKAKKRKKRKDRYLKFPLPHEYFGLW